MNLALHAKKSENIVLTWCITSSIYVPVKCDRRCVQSLSDTFPKFLVDLEDNKAQFNLN